jgi:hypothetical protein
MRANAWEGIGKELKIKRKFYVSSRDVRIVCPRLKTTFSWDVAPYNLVGEVFQKNLVLPSS